MAKRVVVEMQMKTIKRYSFAGILSCLFLLVLVALPIVEMFFPFTVVNNLSYSETLEGSIKVLDIIKETFKMNQKSILDFFTYQGETLPQTVATMYNIFITGMPYFFIAITAIYFIQCATALWALILVFIFIFRGRWSHFKSPRVMSHFAFFGALLIMLGGQGISLFATGTSVGKYVMEIPAEVSGSAFLYFTFPGWLYSLIYFGVGFVAFAGIYFCYEYGLVDRIYIGKNRRKNEPDVTFFDKGNYTVEKNKEETPKDKKDDKEEVVGEVKHDAPSPDEALGTTVKPKIPTVVPEPNNGLPDGLTSIGDHGFSENQCLIDANIPNVIENIGDSAFSNCLNLKTVTLPNSLKTIGSNCFFNCARLVRINYLGTKAEWKTIKRGSNWLLKAGTKIVYCSDGPVQVNPIH